MNKLIQELIVVAASLSGYDLPDDRPELVYASVADFQAAGKGAAVLALYQPGLIILREDLLPGLDSVQVRSHLVHELVHFLQHQAAGGADTWTARLTCRQRTDLEHEAYKVQNSYLRPHGLRVVKPERIC